MSRYQLRRIGMPDNSTPSLTHIILDADVLKFGRNPDQVQVVLHSTFYSNMISREHAEIRRNRNQDGTTAYYLFDRSLNGTYVNEYRAKNQILLHPGDTIKFGHINGAAIPPGQHAPQPHAEFTYIFEKVPRSSNAVMSPQPVQQSGYIQQATGGYSFNGNGVPTPNMCYGGFGASGNQQALVRAQAQAAAYQPRLAAAYASYGATAFNAAYPGGFLSAAATHPAYAALYGHYRTPGTETAALCSPWQGQRTIQPMGSVSPVMPQSAGVGGCSLPTTCAAVMNPAGQLVNRTLDNLGKMEQQQSSVIVGGSGLVRSVLAEEQSDVKKMECDSSVPSPPKTCVSAPGSHNVIDDDQDLRALAASAAENSRLLYSNSPDELFASTERNDELPSTDLPVEQTQIEPATVSWRRSPSPERRKKELEQAALLKSRRRKSNEVARLLNDLTEGSFMHQAARRTTPKKHKQAPAAALDESTLSPSNSSTSAVSNGDAEERRWSPAAHTLSDDASDERDREKCSPLKKRKGFRSPLPPSSPRAVDNPLPRSDSPKSPDRKKRNSLASALRGPRRVLKKYGSRTVVAKRGRGGRRGGRGGRRVVPVEGGYTGDVWSWHEPEQTCAAAVNCLKPPDDNVNWVACDECTKWYHVDCVECDYEDAIKDDFVFHCGCAPVRQPRRPKKRSRAGRAAV